MRTRHQHSYFDPTATGNSTTDKNTMHRFLEYWQLEINSILIFNRCTRAVIENAAVIIRYGFSSKMDRLMTSVTKHHFNCVI